MAKPAETEWASEPRTLLKHQIYKRYVDCWMGKILQHFDGATIVDAFAGPGAYSDGPDGSSIVVAKAFLNHTGNARFHPLRLICNEGDPTRRDALDARVKALPSHPALLPDVRPAAEFSSVLGEIDKLAHRGNERLPTLWILDPFDISSLPFSLVQRCLTHPFDEVLITWFSDEIYRFCERDGFDQTLDTHYGGAHWRDALTSTSEHERKAALTRAYQDGLEALPEVKASAFSISSKNATARYSIIFATHSDKGLECWNPVKWGLDPAAGQTVSEKRGPQEALFDDREKLRQALRRRAGTAASFEDLRVEATRLGFLETQLRTTLGELSEGGFAVRERPLDAAVRSPWPSNSLIRFYDDTDDGSGGPQTDQAGR
jgi:three-Cys-motif partner protein